MRLETIALKGIGPFTGEVRLDLRDLPPGLIAIVGENGAGKTMFLEAPLAVLDRAFISRGDKAPLTDYCGGDRGAYFDATYLFEGRGQYRARLNLDGLKGGSEAVLEHVATDGRRKALNDGKVSTYDVARAQIFPSREVLLASAFAAQNRRGSFVTLGKGERKELFAALLGLEKYGAYAETARKAAAALDVKRGELRALITRLEAESNAAITDQIAIEANQLQADIGAAEVRAAHLASEIAALEQQLFDARDNAQAYAAAVSALATLQEARRTHEAVRDRADASIRGAHHAYAGTIAMVERERDRRLQAATAAIAAEVSVEGLTLRLERDLAEIERDVALDRDDRETRLRNNRENLLDQAASIRNAVKERAGIERTKGEDQRQRATVAAFLASEESDLRAAQAEVLRRTPARQALEAARRGAGVLDGVPCGGAGTYAACQFLQDARASRENLPALEANVRTLEQAEAKVADYLESVERARASLQQLDAQLAAADRRLAALKPLADRAAALEHAEQRVAELERDLAQIEEMATKRRAKAQADHDARLIEREQRLAAHNAELLAARAWAEAEAAGLVRTRDAAIAEAEAQRHVAVQAIAALAVDLVAAEQAVATSRVDQDAVTDLEQRLALARADHHQTQTTLARLDERVQALAARRAAVLAKRDEAESLRTTLAGVDRDAIEWESLARIFGKDGLPVLEIDAAGPTVSALTNDLLQACFGSRFTVELVTQEAKASGKGLKEVFELKVWDAERPGDRDRDVSDLSGGEQVLIDEALKSAIAIFVNTRNEAPIRTCWRDETTGALDPENATRYMQMLRRVHERGGFAHVLFISHNADAAAMADAQIRVADGAITLQYAPFGVAA
jgi:DNA repair protein SbcC/Rad50